jgi:hypothetical protein
MLHKGLDQFAKLSCRWRYSRLLSTYVDNELKAPAADDLSRHLHECSRCRAEFEQLRLARRALREFEIPPMRSPLIGGQVFHLQVLKEVSPLKRLFSQKIAVPLPLAAGLSIALLGAGLFSTARNQRTFIQSIESVPASPSVMIKVVEIPVERVITRTVYVRQPVARRGQNAPKENDFLPNFNGDIAQSDITTTQWSDGTLKDFRPAESANLRVVKEHDR